MNGARCTFHRIIHLPSLLAGSCAPWACTSCVTAPGCRDISYYISPFTTHVLLDLPHSGVMHGLHLPPPPTRALAPAFVLPWYYRRCVRPSRRALLHRLAALRVREDLSGRIRLLPVLIPSYLLTSRNLPFPPRRARTPAASYSPLSLHAAHARACASSSPFVRGICRKVSAICGKWRGAEAGSGNCRSNIREIYRALSVRSD
ncbi:hypothetical protein DFH06DRAFT_671085 [Mycena polygramma]|nr:hypothetical protein DFH06DRAFT_671085 [Mycena polygramma]